MTDAATPTAPVTQDLITRLDNQAAFNTRLESAIAAARERQVESALLVVRLEPFRKLLDSLGTAATNRVLADIGQFLEQAISKPFSATRLSDNEFAVLLFSSSAAEAGEAGNFIGAQVNGALTDTGNTRMDIHVAVGIAMLNGQSPDAGTMLHRARLNTGLADTPDGTWQDTCAEVAGALASDRFFLVYQPLFDMRDWTLRQFQATVRLQDTAGNTLLPGAFMQAANLCGLALAVDKWVLDKVLAQPRLDELVHRLFLHLSANSPGALDQLSWLDSRLAGRRQLARHIVLQIDEALYYRNPRQVKAFADCLHAMGLALGLAGFGARADPMPALKALQPRYVSLADSLYRDLPYSDGLRQSLAQLVHAVHHRDAKVLAGRIENMQLLPLLHAAGVDSVYGYSLQAPCESMEFNFPEEEEIILTN